MPPRTEREAVRAPLDVRPEVDADDVERRVELRELRAVAGADVDDPPRPETGSDPPRVAIDVRLPDDPSQVVVEVLRDVTNAIARRTE